MTKTQMMLSSALSTMILAGLAASPAHAGDAKPNMEKCAGISKAAKNDCGTSKHSCAGQAAKDGDKEEWVFVPAGTCEKIVGGITLKKKA